MKSRNLILEGGYSINYDYLKKDEGLIFYPDSSSKFILIKDNSNIEILNCNDERKYNIKSDEYPLSIIDSFIQRYVYPTDFWIKNNHNPEDYLPSYSARKRGK